MSMTEQMDDIPQPVTYEPQGDWTTVLIRINIEAHTEGEGGEARTYYTDDLTRIIVRTETLTPEIRADIERDPAAYVQRIEVDDVKPEVLDKIQHWVDKSTKCRTTVPCEGIPVGIVFDTQSCINAMGLEVGDMFIDSADGVHILKTTEDITRIKNALKGYVTGLYAKATEWRKRTAAATTRKELDDISAEIDSATL